MDKLRAPRSSNDPASPLISLWFRSCSRLPPTQTDISTTSPSPSHLHYLLSSAQTLLVKNRSEINWNNPNFILSENDLAGSFVGLIQLFTEPNQIKPNIHQIENRSATGCYLNLIECRSLLYTSQI
ncbi:hypothetical protein MJO29_007928 [Puccinia striiformis f. sp. tritici]|nr:hypothetical protein MJO29_007928 [Puccinia striiformis f. sp. tritici]